MTRARRVLPRALSVTLVGALGTGGFIAGRAASDSPVEQAQDGGRPEEGATVTPGASPTGSRGAGSTSTSSASTGASGVMPRLTGLTEDEARRQVGAERVTVRYVLVESLDSDEVLSQEPRAGQPATGEVSLVVRRQARLVTLGADDAGDGWTSETSGPGGRALTDAIGSSAAATTTMALPDGASRLEADLLVVEDQPRVRTLVVTGPGDRDLLRLTLVPGQARPVRIQLPDGGPLTWSMTPAGDGRIVLERPTVWAP